MGGRTILPDLVKAAFFAGARAFAVENAGELYVASGGRRGRADPCHPTNPSAAAAEDLKLGKSQGAYGGSLFYDAGGAPTGQANVVSLYEIPDALYNWPRCRHPCLAGAPGRHLRVNFMDVNTAYGPVKFLGCVVDGSNRVSGGSAVNLTEFPAAERVERAGDGGARAARATPCTHAQDEGAGRVGPQGVAVDGGVALRFGGGGRTVA